MKLDVYTEAEHRAMVDGWYAKAGLKWLGPGSPNGWCATGVAAGWLYTTDGNFVFLEDVVTNPEANSYSRNLALEYMFAAACEKAKELGKTRILALISHDGLQSRMASLGFKPMGIHMLLEKTL